MITVSKLGPYADDIWERLDSHPDYCGGKMRVKDTRYSVTFILSLIGSGYEVADIPKEYVGLEEADIRACARWGARLTSYRRLDTNHE